MAVGIHEGDLVARGESGRGSETLGFALGDGKHLCDAATLVVLARRGFECDGVAARGFYFINPAILINIIATLLKIWNPTKTSSTNYFPNIQKLKII